MRTLYNLLCHGVAGLYGRTTVGLVTPYPPGIPLLIPGEVFNKKIVDYLKLARAFNRECPGFETNIHGLVARPVDANGVKRYLADCTKTYRSWAICSGLASWFGAWLTH